MDDLVIELSLVNLRDSCFEGTSWEILAVVVNEDTNDYLRLRIITTDLCVV